MRSINRVVLLGHIAADPDLRQTKNGHSLAIFPVATNRFCKDANGEKSEVADFHRVVAWNKLAEISSKHLAKGMAVYIEGKVINRSYDDKNGVRHYRTEISADDLNILTWKKSNGKPQVDIENLSKNAEAEELEEDMAVA